MIGTYALTNKLLTHLQDSFDICDKKKELISIGALCHDIGHGPGSHGFDKHVIRKLIANKIIDKNNSMISHEERSCALFAELCNISRVLFAPPPEPTKLVNRFLNLSKTEAPFSALDNTFVDKSMKVSAFLS